MLGKVAKKEYRGTLYGAFGFSNSVGLVIVNLLGGYLYDNVSQLGPLYLGIGALGLMILITLIFGLCGKLKI